MFTPCHADSTPTAPGQYAVKFPRFPQQTYPSHLVTSWLSPEGHSVTLRPIRPEDAVMEQAFVIALSPESRYHRFMGAVRELSPDMLVRFTQIDYDRDMAFVAVTGAGSGSTQVGVCRYITIADGGACEFALAIADHWQHRGLGCRMMQLLIDHARARGRRQMTGEILASNTGMLALCVRLGFSIADGDDGAGVRRATLGLAKRPLGLQQPHASLDQTVQACP